MLKRRSPWFFAPECFCFFFGDSKQSERMWSKNWTARRPKIPKLECILPESEDVLRLWLFEEILWLLRVNFTVGCRMHRFTLLSSSFLQAGFWGLNFTFFKCLQLCSWESSQIFTGSQFPPRPFTGEEEVERSLREMQAVQHGQVITLRILFASLNPSWILFWIQTGHLTLGQLQQSASTLKHCKPTAKSVSEGEASCQLSLLRWIRPEAPCDPVLQTLDMTSEVDWS